MKQLVLLYCKYRGNLVFFGKKIPKLASLVFKRGFTLIYFQHALVTRKIFQPSLYYLQLRPGLTLLGATLA
jgi:hypothetical protein